MASVKRKILTLGDKVNVIKQLEKGRKKADVCREFDMVNSTVCSIWKNRVKILCAFEQSGVNVKRIRKPDKEDVDAALLKWFQQQRSQNVPISGAMLMTKAEQLAKLLNHENFVCSNGWIDRFKARHNIAFHKICGEGNSVDEKTVKEWISDIWPDIRKDYKDNDIFNADETGLFFKLTPDKTLGFKNEKCIGGKRSKERITVFVCGNLTGTEKRTLTVIGKSKRPRSFKNKTLPVHYLSNRNAWMTSELFDAEVRRWDKELRIKKRKVLLLVDNCPAHPHVKNLQQIKLVFLPPNCTSKLQPMDQGVIRSLKCNYRKLMIDHILECLEDNKPCNVTPLNAVRFLDKAWRRVTEKTIRNSFRHAGFATVDVEATDMLEEDEEDLPLSEWIRLRRESSVVPLPNNVSEFVAFQEEVITNECRSDVQIIEDIQNTEEIISDDDEEELEIEETPGIKDAQRAITTLSRFYEARETEPTILNYIGRIEDDIDNILFCSKSKQTKIENYFIKN